MKKSSMFLKNTLFGIGITSSFVTILWAFFPTQLADLVKNGEWLYLLFILVINVLYGMYTIRTKNKINLKLSEKVKAKVFFGDLFKSEGIIIVPVNDYFDTSVDDKVVSSKTLHGIFIKNYFGGNEANLKSAISKGLKSVNPVESYTNRNTDNKKRYPLGTVCIVEKQSKTFYLVALTRFNENHRAEVTNAEYQGVLCHLFDFIEQNSQGRKVNIPLIGAGHSGVKMSKQKLLVCLLFTMAMDENLTLRDGVNIVLHESIKNEIDITKTQIIFKSMED